MKKKYKCRLSATSLLVNVKGNVRRIEFEPSVLSEFGLRGCAYTTDNETLQNAIEHNPRYRNHRFDEVWTDDIDKKVEVVPEPVKEQEVIVEPQQEAEEAPVMKKVVRRGRVKKEE